MRQDEISSWPLRFPLKVLSLSHWCYALDSTELTVHKQALNSQNIQSSREERNYTTPTKERQKGIAKLSLRKTW